MKIWHVSYSDDNGQDMAMMVTASTPLEAFVVWRENFYPSEDWGRFSDVDMVAVATLPAPADRPMVMSWDEVEYFQLNHNSLGAQALMVAHNKEQA